jgi:hypothetical protein
MDADARPIPVALFERWQPVLQCVWATVNEADVDPGVWRPPADRARGPGRPGTPAGPLGAPAGAVHRRQHPMEARPKLPAWSVRQRSAACGCMSAGSTHPAAYLLVHGPGVDSIDGSGFARFTRARLPVSVATPDRPPSRPSCKRLRASRSVDVLTDRSVHRSDQRPTKALLKGVRWAREELNLRPLPCQIPRAPTSLYGGRVETGKDHQKAAGERRSQRPAAPTVCHDSPTLVLVPTAVGCCPSAADRRKETSVPVPAIAA